MKRCGQWLTLPWVTVAVLWSQTPAQGLATSGDKFPLLAKVQVDTLALLSDFSPSGLSKAEDPANDDQSQPDPIATETATHPVVPVCIVSGTVVLLNESPAFRVMIGLPLSRGPPAHS